MKRWKRWGSRVPRTVRLLLGIALAWVAPRRAAAADELLGMFKLDGPERATVNLHFEPSKDRAFMIAELSRAGFPVGAPDAPTPQRSRLLGGIARELECRRVGGGINCRLSVTWGVFDQRRKRAVYMAQTDVALFGIQNLSADDLREALLRRSLESLTARPNFRQAYRLPTRASVLATARALPSGSFRACAVTAKPLPGGAPAAIDATVMVDLGTGFGSGFFLNEEGLVLTAAHVLIGPTVVLRLHDGRSYPGHVLRVNGDADVALLRADEASGTSCLPLAQHEPAIGSDTYAIGAPANRGLAFSITRGIVSSVRTNDDYPWLQSDVPISPGNSGGPLLQSDGRVVAVVQRKQLGDGIEGISASITIQAALDALSLTAAATTTSNLEQARVADVAEIVVRDPPDPRAELDRLPSIMGLPPSPAVVNTDALSSRSDTPSYVYAMRWGGFALAAVGLTAVAVTSANYDKDTTKLKDYQALMTWNDAGWIAAGVGSAAFALSFALPTGRPSKHLSAALSPRSWGIQIAGEL